ncbi:MAG: AI-2E family transporter [Candidatus Vogelbacteria bacterium]|nr:AI-2E family transporter [Candidatus Vogelbacteria bacterium]
MPTENQKLDINVSFATLFKIVVVVAIVFLAYYLRDLVLIILTSIVIASSIDPVATWLEKKKIPRVLSVLLVYVFAFLVIFVVLFFFIPPIFQDLGQIIGGLPAQINNFINSNPAWNSVLALTGNLSTKVSVQDLMGQGLTNSPLPQNAFDIFLSIFHGVFSFIFIVVLSFYLAVQKDGVENFLRIVTPKKQEPHVISLWQRTETKIGRWMQGQILLGIIIGPMVFLGLAILQIKFALLLAIVAAIFELIPIFGPVLSAVPAVLLGASDSFTLGLIVIGFYLVVQQFENHLIYPIVVKKIIGVHPLVVIISLMVGYELAGFLGIILAVPMATLLMEYLGDLEKERKNA